MLTKGYILSLPKFDNKYKVRIPILESNNTSKNQTSFNAGIVDATLSYTEGIKDSLQVNDCVFIDFENDEFNRPVIIGKLFVNNSETSSGNISASTLEVYNKVSLPENTTWKDITYTDLKTLLVESKNYVTKEDVIAILDEYLNR